MRQMIPALALPIIAALAVPLPVAGGHAGCMTKKPNGNIVLHLCKRAPVKPKAQHQPQRKILVVPTGREWGI